MDFLKFFGKSQQNSKDIAKDRLKLVLIHDRSNMSPQLLEMMKADIIKVISDYVEIDEGALEINMTQTKCDGYDGGNMPALVANIPITKIKEKKKF